MKNNPELILALDVDSRSKVEELVKKLYPTIKIFKVGLQIFTASGPGIVEYIKKQGAEVFLDLKFHDIPNTVVQAVKEVVKLKVKMLTVHIEGGEMMLREAVAAKNEEAKALGIDPPLIVGVTVLTSQEATQEEILKRARFGLSCGLDGIVCSPKEAKFLREQINSEFVMVTPGIRASTSAQDDQKRTATVKEAILSGSNFLVVGRPILAAPDPIEAAKEIIKQMNIEH